jgi:very-short-patch-repair endonuclease
MADAIERAIAAVAARQHGYVNRTQLLAIGLGPAAIKHRVARGWLIPVHEGVYAVGHVNRMPVARAAAAVLACGERAALSHGSAASLWGFDKYWHLPYEVTVPGSHRRRPGIKVHRSRTLARRDVTKQFGIRATSPARTVLDRAPHLNDKRLTRMVNDALRSPYLHVPDLADVLDRNPTHPGTKRLRRFAQTARTPTRSPLEDDFLAFARRRGLPVPLINTDVLGYEVDVLFPAERVIVEIDSWEFHHLKSNFESDRDRDADMLAADYVTIGITHERLTQRPGPEARRLHTILEARRRTLTVLSNSAATMSGTGAPIPERPAS